MRARRSWRRGVLVALAALGAGGWASAGCSDTERVHVVGELNEREGEQGQLALGLTARGASGALYRLREAVFQAFQTDGLGFSSAVLFSENDPTATRLETTLPVGGFQIDLFNGWFLEKVEGNSVSRVQATLLSSSHQFFDIRSNEETFVTYRFETNGEIVEFGNGRLIVQIEVDETTTVPPPPVDAGPADPVFGEPLVLVDGLGESSAHGIHGAFFTVTSPVGSSIEVNSSTGSFCVSGNLGQVTDNDFANQWGALIGVSFVSEPTPEGSLPAPWDRDGGRAIGFAFDVTGILPPLRFGALNAGDPPDVINCRPLEPGEGTFVVPFAALDLNCWEGVDNPFVAGNLSELFWTLPADPGSSHAFDFCLSNVRPILQP